MMILIIRLNRDKNKNWESRFDTTFLQPIERLFRLKS